MAGDLDGLGDAATGILAATAVSRGHARHASAADIEHGLCLNCGSELRGDYCHACGQSAHIHRSMNAFFHDLLHGVLHVEGRTWRTLPLLAWRPGDLTRRYVHGERALFVSPLALFLFAVFLLFAVASFTQVDRQFDNVPGDDEITAGMQEEIDTQNARIATLEARMAEAGLTAGEKTAIEKQVAQARKTRDDIAQVSAWVDPKEAAATGGDRRDVLGQIAEGFDNSAADGQANGWLARKIARARANPELLLYKVKTNAYKFGWALIPLSVPFVWLVTIGPGMMRYRFYDHVIFTTYSIAFMLLLLVALLVATGIGLPTPIAAMVAIFYPPFHMYRQLRHAYRLSRPSALIRSAFLVTFAIVALAYFVLGLFALGLAA